MSGFQYILLILLGLPEMLFMGMGQVMGQPLVIAHRGASAITPENTLTAYEKAIELGADFIEIDVRLTKDDSLMVMHDRSVDRTTNGTGTIKELTYAELKALDAGYPDRFGQDFAGEEIPTLYEVLALAKDRVQVSIDMKHGSIERKVVRLVKQFGMEDQVVIGSSDFEQVKRMKESNPEIRALWGGGKASGQRMEEVAAIGGEVLSLLLATKGTIDMAHELGLAVWVWTVNGTDQMKAAIDMGADGVITDLPQSLLVLTQMEIQAYPNPFDQQVTIVLDVEDQANYVRLELFNTQGRQMHYWWVMPQQPVLWEPKGLPHGLYFLKVTINGVSVRRKILYLD